MGVVQQKLDIKKIKKELVNSVDTINEDGIVTKTITEYSNNRVKSIANNVFQNCENLTSVDLSSVETVGDYAFANCSKLSKINIPAVKSIGKESFSYCTILTNFSCNSLETVGNSAFKESSKLESFYLPNVKTLSFGCFQVLSKLKSIKLPSLKTVASSAFYSCYYLETVDLGHVESLNFTDIFYACYSIKQIIIRNTDIVVPIKSSAFNSCAYIKGEYYYAAHLYTGFNSEELKSGFIYVPDELVESYKVATNWATYADQIKPLSEYVEV